MELEEIIEQIKSMDREELARLEEAVRHRRRELGDEAPEEKRTPRRSLMSWSTGRTRTVTCSTRSAGTGARTAA